MHSINRRDFGIAVVAAMLLPVGSARAEDVSRVRSGGFRGWPMGLFFYFILFAVACLYGWVSRSARVE